MKKIISFIISIFMIFNIIGTVDLSIYASDTDGNNIPSFETEIDSLVQNYENKADDFDFTVYVGEHYTSSYTRAVLNHRMSQNTASNDMVKFLSDNFWFNGAYSYWEGVTFVTNPGSAVETVLERETYYETIILKILNSYYSQDNAIDWINQNGIKNAVSISKQLTKIAENDYYKFASDFTKSLGELSDEELERLETFAENYVKSQNYKVIGEDLSFISDVMSTSANIEKFAEQVASYCQLVEVEEATVDFLELMINSTEDKHLAKALNTVIDICNDSFSSTLNSVVRQGAIALGKSFITDFITKKWKNFLISELTDGVLSSGTVILNGALIAISITKTVGNIAFSTDAKLDKYELMKAICSFEEALEDTLNSHIAYFDGSEGSSLRLLAGVELLYQTYIIDTNLYSELAQICKKDWISNISSEELDAALANADREVSIYKEEYESLIIPAGYCGETTSWVVTDENELIIYGVGKTNDYTSTTMPWYEHLSSIQSLCISSYINTIGSYLFYGCNNISGDIVLKNNIVLKANCLNNTGQNYKVICEDSVTFNGEHTISNKLLVKSNLYYSGDVVLNNDIQVGGNISFYTNSTGNLTISNNSTAVVGTVNLDPYAFYGSGNSFLTVGKGSSLYVQNDVFVHENTLKGSNWMTHYANFKISGNVYIYGNLIQTGGHIYEDSTTSYIRIYGDWQEPPAPQTTYAEITNYFTDGIIEVCGNINRRIVTTNNSTLILSGDSGQTINYDIEIANLKIVNSSKNGIIINKNVNVTKSIESLYSRIENGSNIKLSGTILGEKYSGDITLVKNSYIDNDLRIIGNLYCFYNAESNIIIKEGTTLTVSGNLNITAASVYGGCDSTFVIEKNACVLVDKNLSIKGTMLSGSNWMAHYSNLYINGMLSVKQDFDSGEYVRIYMTDEDSFAKLDGNINLLTNSGNISSGTLQINGNINNLTVGGNTKIISSGSRIEKLTMNDESCLILNGLNKQMIYSSNNFSKIFIENTSGVEFFSKISVSILFEHNGNPFILYDEGKGSKFPDYDGDSYKDNIDPYPLVNHPDEHDYIFSKTIAATCVAKGYDEYICPYCNGVDKRNLIDMIPHEYEFKKTVEPTCTAQGYDLYSCSRCNNTEKRNPVEAIGHNYEITNTVDATCTESGMRTQTCSNCGDIKQTEIAALGHSYNSKRIKPTCTERGYIEYNCTRCDNTYIDDIREAVGHDYGSITGKDYINELYDENGNFKESSSVDNYYGDTIMNSSNIGSTSTTGGANVVAFPQQIRLDINSLDEISKYQFQIKKRFALGNQRTVDGVFAYDVDTGRAPENSAIPYADDDGNLINIRYVDYKTKDGWVNGQYVITENNIVDINGNNVCQDYIATRPHIVYTRKEALEKGIMNSDGTVNITTDILRDEYEGVTFSTGIDGIYFIMDSYKPTNTTGKYLDVFAYDENITPKAGSYRVNMCFYNSNLCGYGQIDIKIYDKDELIQKIPATISSDEITKYTCIDCGEIYTETIALDLENFKISTVSLSLESSITMNYKVLKTAVADFENPYTEFTRNGKVTTVSEYTEQGNYYVFSYKDIAPQCMNDTVTAVLHATHNDIDYSSNSLDFSVAKYAYGMLDMYSGDQYAKLRTLLVDFLNYGAESQKYQNYKTDDLVNAKLTETQKSWASAQALNLTNAIDTKYKTVDNPTVEWKSAGLQLNDSVAVRYKFTAKNIDGLQLKVTCGASEWIYTSDDFTYNGDGTYTFLFNDLNADKMQEDIFITAINGDKAVSNTMRYSVESYAKQVQDAMPNSSLRNLTDAMMRYGISASNYA